MSILYWIPHSLNALSLKATVLFNFDACDYVNPIKASIQALTFTNEINYIVDAHLAPVRDRAAFLSEDFFNDLKSAIAPAAEAKVNEAKTAVITQLDALVVGCTRRRLGEMVVVGEDGSQRKLQGGLTFDDLATSIQMIEGVVSSDVSYLE